MFKRKRKNDFHAAFIGIRGAAYNPLGATGRYSLPSAIYCNMDKRYTSLLLGGATCIFLMVAVKLIFVLPIIYIPQLQVDKNSFICFVFVILKNWLPKIPGTNFIQMASSYRFFF